MEDESTLFDKLIIGVTAVVMFLIVSIILMIPIANVFIAGKLFSK